MSLLALGGLMLLDPISPRAAETESGILDVLMSQMASEDKVIKREASYRISQMGPEAQKAVPVLIKALEDRDDQIWFNSITALARIGPGAREAVPDLIRELERSQQGRYRDRSQYRAAFALGSVGPAALPALRKALSHDKSYVRAGAAKALTWMGAPARDLIPDLIKNLDDEDSEVRAATAEALGAIGMEACEPSLAVLRDEKKKPAAKVAAAEALGWMEHPTLEKIEILIQVYGAQSDPSARAAVIRTLDKWRCEPNRFLPLLLPALKSDHEDLRAASLDSLVLLDSPSKNSVPVLTKLLGSDEEVLRARAIGALAALGSEARAAVGALEALAQNSAVPEETRQACRDALAAINP